MTISFLLFIGMIVLVLGRGDVERGVRKCCSLILLMVWAKPKDALGTTAAMIISGLFALSVCLVCNVATGGLNGVAAFFILALSLVCAVIFIRNHTKPGKRAESLPRRDR